MTNSTTHLSLFPNICYWHVHIKEAGNTIPLHAALQWIIFHFFCMSQRGMCNSVQYSVVELRICVFNMASVNTGKSKLVWAAVKQRASALQWRALYWYSTVYCSVLKWIEVYGSAVYCSVMQCITGYFSVLHCIAVNWSVLQYITVYCYILQCVEMFCSVVHCIAVYCNILVFSTPRPYQVEKIQTLSNK